MKNEEKSAKRGFKIMTAVITVCAVLCTVFSAASLVLRYKDHILLKKCVNVRRKTQMKKTAFIL